MPTARRASSLLAYAASVAVVAVLGLAACGGEDEMTTRAAQTGTEVTETTTGEPTDTTSTTKSTTTAQDDVDVDALREDFNAQLRRVLTQRQDLNANQADCAIDELQKSLTADALRLVAETGQPPEDLIDAAFDAGAACKDE